ncbi:hypothetical protein SBA3_1660001 [Candidatus Sulfopaludibacter sp. SbA3]|nr:hypothetical protein SBA3_1660001 [Candidatus Sulfopaludibacter sp. SbA3]
MPGSKFAAFWRIFVPGSNLPLCEIPTRSPTILIPPGGTVCSGHTDQEFRERQLISQERRN